VRVIVSGLVCDCVGPGSSTDMTRDIAGVA
jgi:hypothetical protein